MSPQDPSSSPGPVVAPTASVDADASLGAGVRVEPHAFIGPDVEIGEGTFVGPHAVIQGPSRIGCNNRIQAHACLGGPPQDMGWQGEPTRLEIGDANFIGEFVSMHRASTKEEGVTRVGSHGFFMAYSHFAHDCQVGDHVVLANSAHIGGHVHIGDCANIAGGTVVHQFVHIGEYAMVGGGTLLVKDAPPYMNVTGNRARLFGLNRRGLQRAGFPADTIRMLQQAHRVVFRSGLTLRQALDELKAMESSRELQVLIDALEHSNRGVTR